MTGRKAQMRRKICGLPFWIVYPAGNGYLRRIYWSWVSLIRGTIRKAWADSGAGGTTESQKEFLETLAADDTRKADRQSSKRPPVANDFAVGYTYHDVLDADQEGMAVL
jgi:hypothetical protein